MTRFKLANSSQPIYIRWPLGLFEFAASLGLAVTLIFMFAGALGLATFVEAAYGTPVAQFYVYRTWWFTLILILLGVNIFCAAAIRYPWKRHQTGFVITHIGLLTLLVGSYISRNHWLDAQISVFEGQMDKWAVENAVDLALEISPTGKDTEPQRVNLKFKPGLFNWDERSSHFAWTQPADEKITPGNEFSWKLFRSFCGGLFRIARQHRPGDVLYNRGGVKLEVLDFYSDSRPVNAPSVKFQISMPTEKRFDSDGKEKAKATTWVPAELSVMSLADQPEYPYGWSEKLSLGAGAFTLQLGGSDAQTDAFLKSGPEGELGEQGQAVIFAGGEATRINVKEKLGQGKFKLGGNSGLSAEVVEFWPAASLTDAGGKLKWQNDKRQTEPLNPAVKIQLFKDDKPQGELLLLAVEPHSSLQDHQHQVYGEYWFDHTGLTKEARMSAGITPRIDFFAGHDGKLYYRYWDSTNKKVAFARELSTSGTPEEAVEGFTMPIGQLKLYVSEFVTSTKPEVLPAKQAFVKDRLIGEPAAGGRMPATRLRLTVDDKSEEFWLFANTMMPDVAPTNRPNAARRIQMMHGKDDRVVVLTMPIEAVDTGLRVRLGKFERKLDPGTDQPSHYASWVDFVDHVADRAIFALKPGQSAATSFILPEMVRPTAIAFDAEHDYVYWVDAQAKEIRRAKWSDVQRKAAKAEVETIVSKVVVDPKALAIDGENQKLYWSDRVPGNREDTGLIRSADTDGGNITTVARLQRQAEVIVLDPGSKHLYFVTRRHNAIGRASYDGNDVEEDWFTSATRPAALAINLEKKQLYWAEAGRGAIRKVSLTGSGEGLVLSRKEGVEVLALAVGPQDERLYFMESYANPTKTDEGLPTSKPRAWRLTSATLTGGDEQIESDRTIDEPQGLVLDPQGTAIWTQTATTRTDVWITMNAPVDCFDPTTGRSYRMFQESFSGPFKPGEGVFEEIVGPSSTKDELYRSVLSVNYDPGRGIRNVGCLLICVGIGTMFYMRAYFFKAKGRPVVKAQLVELVK